MAPSHAAPVANAGRTGTMAFESAITAKTPRQTTRRYAFIEWSGLYHTVRLKVHRRVCLDVVTLVNGTGKIDGVILVAVDTEDLLGPRLDLADVIHQLPAIGVPRESVDGIDLEVDGDRAFPAQGHLAPSLLDAPALGSVSLVTDKDERVLLVLCKVEEVFHDRAAVEHTAGGYDHAGIAVDHLRAELG